ncbi:MAG: hypothetical protein IRZ06_05505 [Nevskia sp.]|nr:hypothetical protein [Nevskia sp.]
MSRARAARRASFRIALLAFAWALPPAATVAAPSSPAPADVAALSDAALAALQDRVRLLQDELAQIPKHENDDARRAMVTHWEAVQDLVRAQLRALSPPPTGAEGFELAYGSAVGCSLPPDMDLDIYRQQMRDLLFDLQAGLTGVTQLAGAQARAGRLADLWVSAYRRLQTLRGMGWLYGKPAPSAAAERPLPASASEGAFLLRRYCTQCHAQPTPALHSANEWQGVAAMMKAHMALAKASGSVPVQVPTQRELSLILTYLEDYGCTPGGD